MSEEELIRIVKKSKEPVRSMQELSKKLIGTRSGMFFYTENFRLDFDTFCWKLDYYEKEIERLKERLSFYESDDDIVLMSKEKYEEIKQELQIEKATNKELLSTGADLENKLYGEQDKNKRLNNIINELEIILRQKGIEITIYDQPNYEKISGYVSITMTPEQLKKELKGSENNE